MVEGATGASRLGGAPGAGGGFGRGDGDRAGRGYWDAVWSRQAPPLSPSAPLFRNHAHRRFRELVDEVVRLADGAPLRVLEVGCARSKWLPHLALAHGAEVAGLDYSAAGCEQARAMLAAHGARGEVVCGDLFAPPAELVGAFDLVLSFGLVEHFDDTAGCVRALRRFLAPGGLMLTEVPNMAGVVGRLQKRLDRVVYDAHVPLTADGLRRAHETAGLEVLRCEHFLFVNFGVCDVSRLPRGAARTAKSALHLALGALSRAQWAWEGRRGRPWRPRPALAPYVVCVARAPDIRPDTSSQTRS